MSSGQVEEKKKTKKKKKKQRETLKIVNIKNEFFPRENENETKRTNTKKKKKKERNNVITRGPLFLFVYLMDGPTPWSAN